MYHKEHDSSGLHSCYNCAQISTLSDYSLFTDEHSIHCCVYCIDDILFEKGYHYQWIFGVIFIVTAVCFQKDDQRQSTEFYAWMFGAAMLGIISMVMMTSCFVYCLRSDKWRQRRAARRKWDKNGEYERVDSVLSIVDNNTQAQPQDYNDNDIDAVSII